MAITVPTSSILSDVEITKYSKNSITESFTGIQNILNRGIDWYELKFKMTASGALPVRDLEMFADQVVSTNDSFEISIGSKGKPFENITGAIKTLDNYDAGVNKVKIKDITAGNFTVGDYISFGSKLNLYRVVSYNRTTKEIEFTPKLRKPITINSLVKYSNLKMFVRLSKSKIRYKYLKKEDLLEVTFDCREVIH